MSNETEIGRGAILDLLSSQTRALHAREIAARLHVEETAYPGLLRMLDDLAFSGAIHLLGGQRFRAQKGARGRAETPLREGILSVNPRGFGFVATAGHEDDLYIPEEAMGGAMHRDLVRARVVSTSRRGSEGEIVEVVRRALLRVPGVVRRRGKGLWLETDDTRVRGPMPLADNAVAADARDGDAAVATITRYPLFPREVPEAALDAVLGPPGDPKVEIAKILVREGVEETHPTVAISEAEAFGGEVSPEALVGREDFTHLPLPTIDPEDARDHDDAVWAERLDDGSFRTWIAIADVSHYVRPGTELDRAAASRGCSIYLPDRAIPMLPRELSAHLCSLLPDAIRLCLCVEAAIDSTGTVTSFRVAEGFMRSAAKLTYGGVARALKLTDQGTKSEQAEALLPGLRILQDLSGLLRQNRMRRGALDFDLPEPHVVLDRETGAPLSVERRGEDPGVRKAYQLIEELMLLANELVAQFLTERAIPTIYRVHAPPDEEKLERFAGQSSALGITFDLDEARDPKKLSRLLKRVAKHPARDVFNMLLLRAMKQAAYDVANVGHFGLASTHYLHFTSPIRRYPDLLVHRSVRAVLRGASVDKSPRATEVLRESATLSSDRERRAMDIEREAIDLYRALYMQDHIGETFAGRATALVGSGIFVQLDHPFVDVLIKTEDLGPDEYEMDDSELKLVARRSGDTIALGDPVEVVVTDAAVLRRTVYARRVVEAAPGRPTRKDKARPPKARGRTTQAVARKGAQARPKQKGRSPKR